MWGKDTKILMIGFGPVASAVAEWIVNEERWPSDFHCSPSSTTTLISFLMNVKDKEKKKSAWASGLE